MDHVGWLSDAEQRAWRSVQEMHLLLDGELARRLAIDSGLSHPDYVVLAVLTASPDGTRRLYELGQELGWEKSRLSHHIARMVGRGLVTKEKCDSDGRGWLVVVTGQGRREIEDAAPGHVEAVRELFIDPLTPEQLDAIADAAQTVLAAFTPR